MLQLFLPLCKFSASICPLGHFHRHIWLHICCQCDTWNTVIGAKTPHIGKISESENLPIIRTRWVTNPFTTFWIQYFIALFRTCILVTILALDSWPPWSRLFASYFLPFSLWVAAIVTFDHAFAISTAPETQSQQSGECTKKLENLLIIITTRSTIPLSSIRIIWFLALLGFAHFFCLFYWVFRWTSWGLLPFSIFAFYFLQYRVWKKIVWRFFIAYKFFFYFITIIALDLKSCPFVTFPFSACFSVLVSFPFSIFRVWSGWGALLTIAILPSALAVAIPVPFEAVSMAPSFPALFWLSLALNTERTEDKIMLDHTCFSVEAAGFIIFIITFLTFFSFVSVVSQVIITIVIPWALYSDERSTRI